MLLACKIVLWRSIEICWPFGKDSCNLPLNWWMGLHTASSQLLTAHSVELFLSETSGSVLNMMLSIYWDSGYKISYGSLWQHQPSFCCSEDNTEDSHEVMAKVETISFLHFLYKIMIKMINMYLQLKVQMCLTLEYVFFVLLFLPSEGQ